jgi:hypothetical protein
MANNTTWPAFSRSADMHADAARALVRLVDHLGLVGIRSDGGQITITAPRDGCNWLCVRRRTLAEALVAALDEADA